MTITRINQVESGLEKLLSQFQDKPNIEAILRTYLEASQETQGAYEEMLDERSITTAVGAQLDVIGTLVGEPRKLREDEAYRIAIIIRIAINTNNGTLPDLLGIIKLLTNATEVRISEHFPASVYIYVRDAENLEELRTLVEGVLPVGVSLGYIGYDNNPLTFTPYTEVAVQNDLIDSFGELIVTDTDEQITSTTILVDITMLDGGKLEELAGQPTSGYGICAELI